MGRYSGTAFLYHSFCYFVTRIFYSPARLIRFPIDVRNRKGIKWGADFTTGRNCRLESLTHEKTTISFGRNVQINDNVHVVAAESVNIGNDVLIASKVFISDCSHGIYQGPNASSPESVPKDRPLVSSPVSIGDRVWIGDNVVIMPGVTIGAGAIIGASAVVSGDVPPNSIAVGIPARVIKLYDKGKGMWMNVGKEDR